jgi:hypothetical protein
MFLDDFGYIFFTRARWRFGLWDQSRTGDNTLLDVRSYKIDGQSGGELTILCQAGQSVLLSASQKYAISRTRVQSTHGSSRCFGQT